MLHRSRAPLPRARSGPSVAHRGRLRSRMSLAAAALAVASLAALIVSSGPRSQAPPDAEFLVATPDSTFWISAGASGTRVRGVPMTLAYYGGRFHEVYVADLDRSFEDALFTGERLFVRDLESGDSSLVYDDTAVVRLAAMYAHAHPAARPLAPGDEGPEEPDVSAAGETDVIGVRGSFVLLEHRFAFEHAAGEQYDTVRTALDLRTGRIASPSEVMRADAAADTAAVDAPPRAWRRRGYELLARGGSRPDGERQVSFALRDGDGRTWPLLTVGSSPRLYWLEPPVVTPVTRQALGRAFNEAASYDETVRFASLR